MAERYKTYSAFFDFYLSEHSQPATRAVHYLGSTFGIAALILTITTRNPLWILAGLIAGYAPGSGISLSSTIARPLSNIRCGRSWATTTCSACG